MTDNRFREIRLWQLRGASLIIRSWQRKIGADDVDPFESPRPDLLREITGIEPVPTGTRVMLDEARIRSTQRLALADVGGGVIVGLWPAELQPQAQFLYQQGRGGRLIAAARERGWSVKPSPHLGFFNSRHTQRLYMNPEVSAEEYAHDAGKDRTDVGSDSWCRTRSAGSCGRG